MRGEALWYWGLPAVRRCGVYKAEPDRNEPLCSFCRCRADDETNRVLAEARRAGR